MNIVVIGLGSMGRRRVRLLKQYIENEALEMKNWRIIGIDSNVERCKQSKELYGIKTYFSLEEMLVNVDIDCAIISTPPHTHVGIIKECLENQIHVFSELNLQVEGYDENIQLAKESKRVLFLSSTFLYRKEMQYIKEVVQKNVFQGLYRYHVGQYLPEWHPWENYKNFFVNRKDSNGCRELFAIELPWLIDVFGEIQTIHSIHKRVSNLEIDYDDSYQVLIEHTSGIIGNLSVDIVTPKASRELEIFGERFYIKWQGTPDSLVKYSKSTGLVEKIFLYDRIEHAEGYNEFVVENAYYDELVNFIRSVQKIEYPIYSFKKNKEVLFWIDEIEK